MTKDDETKEEEGDKNGMHENKAQEDEDEARKEKREMIRICQKSDKKSKLLLESKFDHVLQDLREEKGEKCIQPYIYIQIYIHTHIYIYVYVQIHACNVYFIDIDYLYDI
jgi:hypothetical protein